MASFGGDWTRDKLNMVERYLNAYTTALKNTDFRLIYIDAFAGTGVISLRQSDKEERQFLEGSAIRAKRVKDKYFDDILLVEKDARRCAQLAVRMDGDRRIRVVKEDANCFLRNLSYDWRKHRGVLFLDPFATEVEWSTIERVASFQALDIWILFPTMAIVRMLTLQRMPDENHERILTRVYGDKSWQELYRPNPQFDLLNHDSSEERQKGTTGLLQIYKNRLRDLYGNRFMEDSRSLRTHTNTRLFELIFCVGNPGKKAIATAKRIARHIITEGGHQ